ncbi:hypothetical protein VP01_4143g2, partial [Puccinia sorghi]
MGDYLPAKAVSKAHPANSHSEVIDSIHVQSEVVTKQEIANADAQDLFGDRTIDPQFAQFTPEMGSTKIPPTTHDDDNGEGMATEHDGVRDLHALKEVLGGLQRKSQLYGSDDNTTRSLGFICCSSLQLPDKIRSKALVPGVKVRAMTDVTRRRWRKLPGCRVPRRLLRGGGKKIVNCIIEFPVDRIVEVPVKRVNVAVPVDWLLEVQKIVT